MKWIEVSSSNLGRIAWKDEVLYVEFLRGAVYEYAGVPHHIFVSMQQAESVGKFLAAEIKPNYTATVSSTFAT